MKRLVNMLDTPDADKLSAVMHLENIGQAAQRALPALFRLRHSPDVSLRCPAIRAIEHITQSPLDN
jgi:hypothetical protein